MFQKKIIGVAAILVTGFALTACSPDPTLSYKWGRTDYQQHNYQKAFHHFMEAAKWRNANAQYAVAYMYYYGLGVQQDMPRAIYWMRKAAASGNANAKAVLPSMEANKPDLLFIPADTAAMYSTNEPVTVGTGHSTTAAKKPMPMPAPIQPVTAEKTKPVEKVKTVVAAPVKAVPKKAAAVKTGS